MRVYVAGPMRGRPEWNFPAFTAAAERLRAAGHDVVSPAEHDLEMGFDPTGMTGHEDLSDLGFDLRKALVWDLEQVSESDGVFLLPGWEQSAGARAEHALAVALGLLVATDPAGPWTPATPLGVRPRPRGTVIGLGGWKTAGKDTLADGLVGLGGWSKVGMSDPLWQMLLRTNPALPGTGRLSHFYAEMLHEYGSEEQAFVACKKHPEVRMLLQRLGTEAGRAVLGENVWVDAMLDSVLAQPGNVAVTGVRYLNELEALRDIGATLVWVHRPGVEAPTGSHASETSLGPDDFDVEVVNDSTPQALLAAGRSALRARGVAV